MKLKHLMVALCGLFMIALTACNCGDKTVTYEQLPDAVKQFLAQHFPNEKVQAVTLDTDDAMPEYNINYANGTKVEIDTVGTWREICNRTDSVPVTMLPDTTQTYLAANYAKDKVVKLENERPGYEVKLANGTELKFDAQGVFVRVDE